MRPGRTPSQREAQRHDDDDDGEDGGVGERLRAASLRAAAIFSVLGVLFPDEREMPTVRYRALIVLYRLVLVEAYVCPARRKLSLSCRRPSRQLRPVKGWSSPL